MKVLRLILILFVVGICLSCQTNSTNEAIEELEVYKILLTNKPKEIVVINQTIVGVFGEIETGGLKHILKGLQDDTFESLAKRNLSSTDITFHSNLGFDYQILSQKDFETKKEKLIRYYLFSRVGFSNDGKQAVVRFDEVCHPLCSKGAYYLLSKKKGFWQVEEESEYWRS
ncbi:MAG: hypothetical protein AAB336_01235 [Acidobacteriota bacterium]